MSQASSNTGLIYKYPVEKYVVLELPIEVPFTSMFLEVVLIVLVKSQMLLFKPRIKLVVNTCQTDYTV